IYQILSLKMSGPRVKTVLTLALVVGLILHAEAQPLEENGRMKRQVGRSPGSRPGRFPPGPGGFSPPGSPGGFPPPGGPGGFPPPGGPFGFPPPGGPGGFPPPGGPGAFRPGRPPFGGIVG
ncbi:unnamed protein product, partial [Meganyctiphanes norvegica]